MVSATLFVATSFFLVRIAGVYGIPLGQWFGYGLGAWFLLYLLRRRFGKIGFGAVRDVSIRICGASLIMAVFIMGGNWLVSAWPMHGFAAKVMAFVLPSGTGFVALLISLLSLGVLDPCLFDKVSPYLGRWRSRLMDLAGYPQGLP